MKRMPIWKVFHGKPPKKENANKFLVYACFLYVFSYVILAHRHVGFGETL